MKKIIMINEGLLIILSLVFMPVMSHAQIGINVSGSTTADTSVGVYSNSNSDSEANEEDPDSQASLKINASGVAVISSSQVNSEADLKIFSSNILTKEKAIAKVDFNSKKDEKSEVRVVYKHKGKFLGFIPVTIRSTTVVEAKANVETEVRSRLSWWSFLVADENYTQADLESRIKSNTTVKANAKVNASASANARIAEAVIAEIEANANAQTSINK